MLPLTAGFEYLDDVAIADVAFRAWGADLAGAFAAAARATVSVMLEDLASLEARCERRVDLEADQLDLLLFDFLSELVYYKDADGLLLLPRRVEVQEPGAAADRRWRVRAVLAGERVDRSRHAVLVDVKAVTLHRLSLRQEPGRWVAEVVLDI
ncbi:MAG: archease [Gemmatimonadota bacterium]